MRTSTRDQVVPALQKAQDTLTDSVLPAVVGALAIAKEKGADLLDGDTAIEAKRRSLAVVKAARGDYDPPSRWRFGLGMLALGAAFGAGIAYAVRALGTSTPAYTPSGTDGGVTTGTDVTTAAPAGTPASDIDLTAGQPTR